MPCDIVLYDYMIHVTRFFKTLAQHSSMWNCGKFNFVFFWGKKEPAPPHHRPAPPPLRDPSTLIDSP